MHTYALRTVEKSCLILFGEPQAVVLVCCHPTKQFLTLAVLLLGPEAQGRSSVSVLNCLLRLPECFGCPMRGRFTHGKVLRILLARGCGLFADHGANMNQMAARKDCFNAFWEHILLSVLLNH